MTNPFPYSADNKRYHTWNYHMRQTFGRKVMKIPLDAGFTCPNIDGAKGVGGCIYCSPAGSGEFAGRASDPIAAQFQDVREKLGGKWPQAFYIAYFQAHSNTYASLRQMRAVFEPVLSLPKVVGLSIATRADCLSPETVAYLRELSGRTWLLVELGLQTVHDSTAKLLNRCHDYREFLQGYERLREAGLRVCVHLINGLPGESKEDMLETARRVGRLHPHSVKLHMLHVLRGTQMAELYARGTAPLLSREAYVDIVCDQLRSMPQEVVIQRLTGDGKADDLIAPLWTRKKTIVLNEIDKQLARKDTCQGHNYM